MPQALQIPLDQVDGNRGLRSQNWLNCKTSIKDGAWDFWRGQWRADADGHAWFVDPAFGIAAWIWIMWRYQSKHGLRTIAEIVARYAPTTDANDPARYAREVAAAMAMPATMPLNLFASNGHLQRIERAEALCRPMMVQELGADPMGDGHWRMALAEHRRRLG